MTLHALTVYYDSEHEMSIKHLRNIIRHDYAAIEVHDTLANLSWLTAHAHNCIPCRQGIHTLVDNDEYVGRHRPK